MAQSVGAVALDIVMGKNTVTGVVKDAMSECTKVVSDSSASVSSKLGAVGTACTNVGAAIMPASTAVAGLGVGVVKTAANFESSMSQVAATMGMTSEEINSGSESYEKLKQAAKDCGASTKFSASEASEALNYLALAGYDVDKSISTLPTILNLAAAGDLDLASASDMVTDAMSALGETAGTSESFVDKMAKTSQKSNTSVAQLGQAILTVGGTAKNMSGGVTEMNTCLGILADNGIKGAEGGTALRNMILSLSAPTDKAAGMMKELGLEVFDANGKMRPMNDIFKDLNGTLSTMNQSDQINVLNTIFNKVDLKSAQAMLANCGDRFDELSGQIDNADGAAQAMADTMQNNLNGKITTLKSQLEGVSIQLGDILIPIVSDVVSVISKLVDWFSKLGEGPQKIIVGVGLVVAVLGPALIVIGKVITSVSTIISTCSTVVGFISGSVIPFITGTLMPALSGFFAFLLANPIILIITGVIAAIVLLWTKCEWFRDAVNAVWQAVKDAFSMCWDGIVLFFTETLPAVWQTVVEWFQGIPEWWSGIWQQVQEFFSNAWNAILENPIIQTIITTIQDLWNNAVAALQGIWDGLVQIASSAWEMLKNVILGPVLLLIDLVTGNFDKLKSDATNIWNNMKQSATNIWNGIKQVVTSVVNGLVNGVKTVISGLRDTLSQLWQGMKKTATETWNNIKNFVVTTATNLKNSAVTAFQNMVTGISQKLSSLGNVVRSGFSSAISYITSLPSQAFTWGKDFIQGIINGIKSMISTVKDAVSDVANTIRSFLHFSVPDVGPLTDYETWMPDFMQGLARGIKNSKGIVTDEIMGLANDMTVNPLVQAPRITGVNAGTSASTNAADKIDALIDYIRQIIDKNDDRPVQVTAPIYIAGDYIDDYIVNSGNRRTVRSGGRA